MRSFCASRAIWIEVYQFSPSCRISNQPTNFEGGIPSTTSFRPPSQTDFRTSPRLPPHRQHFNLVSRAHSGGLSRRRRPGTGSRRPSHRTVIDSGSRPGLTFLRRLPSPAPRLTGQGCWHHFLHEIVCDINPLLPSHQGKAQLQHTFPALSTLLFHLLTLKSVFLQCLESRSEPGEFHCLATSRPALSAPRTRCLPARRPSPGPC